jgi:hypothetical protein
VRVNLAAFPGRCVMLTLTAPGKELGSFDEFQAGWYWNKQLLRRWLRLRDAAQHHANRKVRRQRSGLLAYVPEVQRRGALHMHVVLGGETVLERRWCEAFGSYCRRNAPRYGFGRQTRLDRNWTSGGGLARYSSKLAGYVSKGGVEALWQDGTLAPRSFYVSRRLTAQTGVTIGLLRRCGYLATAWGIRLRTRHIIDLPQYERAFRRRLTLTELRDLARLE